MANEFMVNRVALASFTLPAMAAGNTSLTLSANLDGLYIPSGALVTRAGFILGAQTDISGFENATLNVSISNIPIFSNNVKASIALTVGVAKTCTMALVVGEGVYIGTGGVPVLHLASSQAARAAISAVGTVHIGYIAKDN